MSHLGATGTALTVLWVVLIPVKALLLGRALRVRIPLSVIVLLTGGGAGLAMMLQSVTMPGVNRSMMVLAVTWWGAALLAFAIIVRPAIVPAACTSGTSRAVCARIAKSLLLLLAGVYLYHVFNYVAWIGVEDGAVIAPMMGTSFVMVALLRQREKEIWMGTALALLSSLAFPVAVLPMSIVLTAVLVYRARQCANTRFLVAAVLTGYLGAWAFGYSGTGWPALPLWPSVVAAGLLALIAWKLREPIALAVLAAGGLLVAARYEFNPLALLPQSRLSLGILLVVAGFLALTLGVWLNWWLRSPGDAPEAGASVEGG